MFQFYLLSILLNAIAGLILISTADRGNEVAVVEEEKTESTKKPSLKDVSKKLSGSEFLKDSLFRLVVGILCTLTGILKLFVVVRSDIIILADFFPAIAGIYAGFAVLYGYYIDRSSIEDGQEILRKLFLTPSTVIGMAAIVVAFLHFVFPSALFL